MLKVLSKYICRQLRYHQHKIRSKTVISLVIILNVFKCLKVSLVPLKFLLWCQVCTFYCPLMKNRYTILPDGTDVHNQLHIHQKDLNLCLTSYNCAKDINELEKTQTTNSAVLWCL